MGPYAGEVENSEWIHKLFLNSGNLSCFPVKSAMHFKEYLLYFNSVPQ